MQNFITLIKPLLGEFRWGLLLFLFFLLWNNSKLPVLSVCQKSNLHHSPNCKLMRGIVDSSLYLRPPFFLPIRRSTIGQWTYWSCVEYLKVTQYTKAPTSLLLLQNKLSLAQFEYMHCVESGAITQSGLTPWPPDVVLVCSQCSNHLDKLE